MVVIFGIAISAVALVAATGMAGLQGAEHAEATNNGLRAIEILDENVDDLVTGRASERATEIKLADAQLSLGDPVTVEVRTERLSDGNVTVYTRDILPIEYDLGQGTSLVYVDGAIIREEYASAVMLDPPAVVLSDTLVILPIFETRAAGVTAVGGARTASVRTHLAETDLVVAEPTPTRVTLTVRSPHATVWQRHFESLACDAVDVHDPETVICTVETNAVYVTAVRVDVSLE
jgi:hypothetical protein